MRKLLKEKRIKTGNICKTLSSLPTTFVDIKRMKGLPDGHLFLKDLTPEKKANRILYLANYYGRFDEKNVISSSKPKPTIGAFESIVTHVTR